MYSGLHLGNWLGGTVLGIGLAGSASAGALHEGGWEGMGRLQRHCSHLQVERRVRLVPCKRDWLLQLKLLLLLLLKHSAGLIALFYALEGLRRELVLRWLQGLCNVRWLHCREREL